MGHFKKWREWPGNGSPRSVILVPGVSAETLEQQTCSHFPKFIDACYTKPNTALTVWVYNHGVTPRTRECWEAFYAAGEDLLEQIIATVKQRPGLDLVLIGHRLGVFLLKKALVLAHRRSDCPGPAALFEALQKIIMIGDPDLHDDNRSDWPGLIQECLQHSKKSSQDLYSEEALDGLKRISDKFENVTLQSQFFQVSGKAPLRRKSLRLKPNSTYKNCLCDANIIVRMWTTADEDESIPLSEGDDRVCVFHKGSKCHKPLLLITSGDYGPPSDRLLPSATAVMADILQKRSNHEKKAAGGVTPGGTQDAYIATPSATASALQTDTNSASMKEPYLRNPENPATNPRMNNWTDSPQPSPRGRGKPSDTADSQILKEADYFGTTGVYNDFHTLSEATAHDAICIAQREVVTTGNIKGVALVNNSGRLHDVPSLRSHLCQDIVQPTEEGLEDISEEEVVRLSDQTSPPRPRPLPLQLGIPPPCKHFVGRTALLEMLRSFLTGAQSAGLSDDSLAPKQRVAILHGIPGIGKTYAAREFAVRYESQFDTIFWIRSDTQADLAQSFHNAAIALGLINGRREYSHSVSTAKLKDWFQRNKSKWLLIFDNVNDYEILAPYMPMSNSGAIIITGRRYTDDTLNIPNIGSSVLELDVPTLNSEESYELFRSALQGQKETLDCESVKKMSDLLEGFPLALVQAAAYVNAKQTSMHQFINDLESNSADLSKPSSLDLEQAPAVPRIISHLTGLRTLSAEADELCAVLACLDPVDMDESLLLAAAKYNLPLRNLPTTMHRLQSCRIETVRHGYICTLGERRLCWKHESLQDAFQASMSLQQKIDALNTTSLLLLSRWPSRKKIRNVLLGFWPEFDSIHTHVRRLSRLWVSLSRQGGSLNALIRDESFMQLLTLSTWYNANIRGNGEEDVNLQELAHTIYDFRSQKESDFVSIPKIPSHVPSRLLYFDHENKECRLVETNGRYVDYIALSYVWGTAQNIPQLTHNTYEHFKRGMSYSEMRLLNTASFFMEQAGTHYLWVDRMCIIQDDPSDKASELSSMANTYANSKATIVCPTPQQSVTSTELTRWNWAFQESHLSPRRLILGNYALHSHGSDMFNQDWFSRVVARSINTSLDRGDANPAYMSSGCPSISCPHQDCDTFYFRLNGDERSFFVDLPEELIRNLQEVFFGLKGKTSEGSHQDKNSTSPKSQADPKEGSLKDREEQLVDSVAHTPKDQSSDGSLPQALDLVQEGLELLNNKNLLRAIGKFFQAREYVDALNGTSLEALRVHMLTSIYIANIYLQESSSDISVDILWTSRDRMSTYNILVPTLLPTVAQFYLTDANVCFARGKIDEATQLYERVIQFTKDAQEDAADFGAIAKLKLAEIQLPNDTEQAQNLIKESVAHFEDQATRRGQAQYARALYYKALASNKEREKMVKKRARRALEDFCEEHGLPTPSNSELTRNDFESILDIGFL